MAITKLSNSGLTTGNLKYDSMLAGNDPGATFLIQRIAGDGSSTTVTFSNIPQNYQHLQIRCLSRNTSGGSGNANLNMRFNSDSGANYTRHYLRGDGSTAAAFGATGNTSVIVQDGDLSWTASASFKGVSIIDIHDYTSTTKNKTVRSFAGQDVNDTAGTTGVSVSLSSALWLNTSAITSITLTSSTGSAFDSSSTFALYGMIGA